MFVTEAKLYTIDRNLQIATGTSPSNSLHVLQALHAAETRLELISLFLYKAFMYKIVAFKPLLSQRQPKVR